MYIKHHTKICRWYLLVDILSCYFVAHIWKIYDLKIEVVPFIINFSTDLTTVVKGVGMKSLYSDTKILSKYIPSLQKRL
jgi:hypothetical protein